jgi:predicted TIM-barrel fold metal-dependent hydrolase
MGPAVADRRHRRLVLAVGIPVMLNAPTLQAEIGAIAARHPRLRLIMDHMGRVKGTKDEAVIIAMDQTAALAKHSNVFVKLTLFPTCSSEPYPYRNLQSALRRLIEAFGPRRAFWGTDLSAMLSRCDCTYRQSVTLFTEDMPFLSQDDIAWIMGQGLADCLGWAVR